MRLAAIIAAATSTCATAAANPLAEGRLLNERLNCAACHAEFPAGIAGPPLAGIGDRLDPAALQVFLVDPQSVKRTSRMPGLLHQDWNDPTRNKAEIDEQLKAEVEALTHFLFSTQSAEPRPKAPAGDADRGRSLYRSVGCVACHDSFGPEDLGNSEDLVLGRAWTHAELVAFLIEPTTPLMPSLKLGPQGAADLAAWIQSHNAPPGHFPHEDFKSSTLLIEQGRELFVARRCVSCHGAPEDDLPAVPGPVAINDWQRGCLAPEPAPGVPNYNLTADQREAMRAASKSPAPQTPDEIIDHTLTLYRCYSCHERNGKGGPSDARRPFFTATEPGAESYGDFGSIPPKLDHVGRKLTRDWLRRILVEGHGEVRPYLATRMPHYAIPEPPLEKFLDALEQADRREPPVEIDVSGLPRHQRGHYGRDLMGVNALNCITCHGLKGERALGAPVIDLTHTVDRLRPGWFKEVLLDPQSVQPGTLMPPLFVNRPKAEEEVEQIWTYLKELDQRRLPDGLLRRGDFELMPAELGKPIVFRTFLEGVGPHAIAVGYPDGTNLAFDARTCRWVLLWTGRFLDAMGTWDDRFAPPAKPLGEPVHRFARDQHNRTFRGFRLDSAGVPTFLYALDGELTEDNVAPQSDGRLLRTVTRAGATTRQTIRLAHGAATFHHAP